MHLSAYECSVRCMLLIQSRPLCVPHAHAHPLPRTHAPLSLSCVHCLRGCIYRTHACPYRYPTRSGSGVRAHSYAAHSASHVAHRGSAAPGCSLATNRGAFSLFALICIVPPCAPRRNSGAPPPPPPQPPDRLYWLTASEADGLHTASSYGSVLGSRAEALASRLTRIEAQVHQ